MTLKEQIYRFKGIDIHAAISIQISIENRLIDLNIQDPDKATKAVIDELKQQYDDLDRHISSLVREQEFQEMAKKG
jgi:uncharacterized protein HemY